MAYDYKAKPFWNEDEINLILTSLKTMFGGGVGGPNGPAMGGVSNGEMNKKIAAAMERIKEDRENNRIPREIERLTLYFSRVLSLRLTNDDMGQMLAFMVGVLDEAKEKDIKIIGPVSKDYYMDSASLSSSPAAPITLFVEGRDTDTSIFSKERGSLIVFTDPDVKSNEDISILQEVSRSAGCIVGAGSTAISENKEGEMRVNGIYHAVRAALDNDTKGDKAKAILFFSSPLDSIRDDMSESAKRMMEDILNDKRVIKASPYFMNQGPSLYRRSEEINRFIAKDYAFSHEGAPKTVYIQSEYSVPSDKYYSTPNVIRDLVQESAARGVNIPLIVASNEDALSDDIKVRETGAAAALSFWKSVRRRGGKASFNDIRVNIDNARKKTLPYISLSTLNVIDEEKSRVEDFMNQKMASRYGIKSRENAHGESKSFNAADVFEYLKKKSAEKDDETTSKQKTPRSPRIPKSTEKVIEVEF